MFGSVDDKSNGRMMWRGSADSEFDGQMILRSPGSMIRGQREALGIVLDVADSVDTAWETWCMFDDDGPCTASVRSVLEVGGRQEGAMYSTGHLPGSRGLEFTKSICVLGRGIMLVLGFDGNEPYNSG
jgi:hypothetical protein